MTTGGATLVAGILTVCIGAMLAIQAPVNAQLGRALASPVAAALVSVVVSSLSVACLLGLSGDAPRWSAPPLWLLLVGGVLGALYVFGSLSLVPRLGSATFFACIIAGQLTAGLILDHLGAFGLPAHEISVGRIAAVCLVLAGVVLLRIV